MSGKSIMIVEDEQITAMELQSMLEDMEFEIGSVVDNAEAALEKIQESRPDLILMDIRLPGSMDGVELTKEISGSDPIPVVYLTAHSDPETLERAKETQPAGYLTKPVTEEDLKTTLEVVLYNDQRKKT